MRPARILACLCILVCTAPAQTTLPELKARLLNQPLYLRVRTRADNLRFDATGKLLTPVQPISFTLAGVQITSVTLKRDRLLLHAQRVGLTFKQDVPARMPLEVPNEGMAGTHRETMQLEIASPPSGDYSEALQTIFTADLADLVPTLPSYWQPFAREHLLGAVPSAPVTGSTNSSNPALPAVPAQSPTYKVAGSVKAPALLTQKEPDFSPQARALRYSGVVLLTLVVDKSGLPTGLSIIHPAGLETDEQALAAAARYTFKPATLDGEPIPVEVQIAVNFQVF